MPKTILITGADGNLGTSVVQKFVQEGYHIAATVAPNNSLGSLEGNTSIDKYVVDLTNEGETDAFVKSVIDKHKNIHAAILLAGGYASGTIENTDGKTLKKLYSLNFETAYFVARPVFKQMIKQNGGRIIFIGARPAIKPADGKNSLAYALSKSLLFTLADNLNAEGAYRNVVTTVIAPSTLDTPANRKAMPKGDPSQWVKLEDVAQLMAYLLSDAASALREPVLKMYGKS